MVVTSSEYTEEGLVTSGPVVGVVVGVVVEDLEVVVVDSLEVVVVSTVVVVLDVGDGVVVRGDVVDLDLIVELVDDEVGVVVGVVAVALDVVVIDVVEPGLESEVVVTSFELLDSELIVPEVDECVMFSGEVLLYVEADLVVVVVAEVVEVGALDGEVVTAGVSFISRASISWRLTKKCSLHTCISSMLSKRSSYVSVISFPSGAV